MAESSETKRLMDPLQSIQNQKRSKVNDLRDLRTASSAASADDNNNNNDDGALAELPTADWNALQHVMTLIRTAKFQQLTNETGYPFKPRRRTTSRRKIPIHVSSSEVQVPHTLTKRESHGYRYFDTETGEEISAETYQERYEQALKPPLDWEAYFSHLRLQKSLQEAAPTIPLQIQVARNVYASKLAPKLAELRDENDEMNVFHDSHDDYDESHDEKQSTVKHHDD